MAKMTFDEFYASQYGERWPSLREAMLSEEDDKTSPEGLLEPYYMDKASIETASLLPVNEGDTVLDMCAAPGGKTIILLMKLMSKGRVASRQQANREVGFRKYMAQHFPQCEIKELLLQIDGNEQYGPQIRDFLQGNPDIRHCITFCSRAYILGEYFRQNGLEDFHLFGYDMVERNVECLKNRSIDFLIAQHPWKQGYNSVKALFNHIVLKKEVQQYNYMPLELLTAENYIYYTADEK